MDETSSSCYTKIPPRTTLTEARQQAFRTCFPTRAKHRGPPAHSQPQHRKRGRNGGAEHADPRLAAGGWHGMARLRGGLDVSLSVWPVGRKGHGGRSGV
jgi:hypothetical protein